MHKLSSFILAIVMFLVACGTSGPPPLDVRLDVDDRDEGVCEVVDCAAGDVIHQSDDLEDPLGDVASDDIFGPNDDVVVDVVDDSHFEIDVGTDAFGPRCGIPEEDCTELTWNPLTQTCDLSVASDGTPCSNGVCRDGGCQTACWTGKCPPGLALYDGCHCRVLPTGSDKCMKDGAFVSCDLIKQGEQLWGQGAHHDARARNFVDQGDGTILDVDTGLVWAAGLSGPLKIGDAGGYCDEVELPGKGWRMPVIQELYTLVDAGASDCNWNEAFGDGCRGNVALWSDTRAYQSANFCMLHPQGGLDACERSESNRVRCVRGRLEYDFDSEGRIEVLPDVILDHVTGLAWSADFVPNLVSWPDALAACASMGVGWRLPTSAELVSIFDLAMEKDGCAIWYDGLGKRCISELYFWSSTGNRIHPGAAYAAHYVSAHIHYNLIGTVWNARCVRSF